MKTLERSIRILRDIREEYGTPMYVVGSGIRDRLFDKKVRRMRILTRANPLDIAMRFSIACGQSDITQPENEVYETLSVDGILFRFMQGETDLLEEELQKRVYTVDAVAMEIDDFERWDKNGIVDPFGGLSDVENRMLRMVDARNLLISPIEFLRGIRLMAENDLDIDRETEDFMKENVGILKGISGKELSKEWFAILAHEDSAFYINLMERHIGMLGYIFPEISAMQQIGECKYHVVDAFTHSVYTLKTAERVINGQGFFEDHLRDAFEKHMNEPLDSGIKRETLTKMGALFHDIGKPAVRTVKEDGNVSFVGHAEEGYAILEVIGMKLGLSERERRILARYALLHMYPLALYKSNDMSQEKLYEMFDQTGEETLDILLIGYSDIVATRALLDPSEEMGNFKVYTEYMANNYLLRYLKDKKNQ